jgi:hypothetical protein
MSIPVLCPHCHLQMEAPPDFAGMTVMCVRCQGQFIVPGPVQHTPAPAIEPPAFPKVSTTVRRTKTSTRTKLTLLLTGLSVSFMLVVFCCAGLAALTTDDAENAEPNVASLDSDSSPESTDEMSVEEMQARIVWLTQEYGEPQIWVCPKKPIVTIWYWNTLPNVGKYGAIYEGFTVIHLDGPIKYMLMGPAEHMTYDDLQDYIERTNDAVEPN